MLKIFSSHFMNKSQKEHMESVEESGVKRQWCFPSGPVVKSPPANAGDTGSIPGPGRSNVLLVS